MEIKSHLIEKINAFEHLKIADEINKMIASNLWLNVLKIERKPNRKMLYTKNF